FGYASLILVGTVMLSLPASSSKTAGRAPLVDAYFTASSAVCVTGLIVRDTQYDFSPVGKGIILLLIQIGGLGYMTLATSFSLLLGRRISLKEKLVAREGLGQLTLEDLGRFALRIFIVTLLAEVIGAAILSMRFRAVGMTAGRSIAFGVFHSVSAFCNAGFSAFSRNLTAYTGDPLISITVLVLFVAGGLGFVVLRDIYRRWIKRSVRGLSFHTKLVFVVTGSLLMVGFAGVLFLERGRTMYGMSLKAKLLASLFQGATPRTAGFSTLNIGTLGPPTLFLMVLLMFVGASPGGTGGGIKTTTFGSALMKLFSVLTGREHVSTFGRRFSEFATTRALILILAGILIVAVGTGLLLVTENEAVMEKGFLGVLFEDVSAFGTVGLSVGSYTRSPTSLSHDFTPFGKIVIALTMLAGRVGPLTLGVAVVLRQRKETFVYPEGRVLIG
ncbi:MAG: potassium transporter TrkG, partial [Thermoplasmata archaeon]